MTCSSLQTAFSVQAGAQWVEKGAVAKSESWEETFPVANLRWKSKRHGLAAACAASGSPSLPAPPLVFADLPHPCPAPPPEPTWRSAQVAVRWSVTPGTGSREGGADARGGDCAGGRGRSAERRGGARRAERRERGGSDMDRGEQGQWESSCLSISGSGISGLLKTEPVAEEGEDAVAMLSAPETLTEEEQEELRRELTKVEEEIQTLSQVLAAKEKHLAEIKRKLGITSLQEFKQNIAKGWQDVTATNAYKKTSETLSQAGQKASAAFSSVGSVITKKLEDVNIRSIQHSISMPAMRNSPTFKSFEEKVENLKSKVGGAKPAGGDFGEVLNSTANATSTTTTEPPPEQTTESP
ncbi:tumor protein D52 isoform X2 [Rattus norvegicus]